MSSSAPTSRHPLVEAVDALEKTLATVTDLDPTWLRLDDSTDERELIGPGPEDEIAGGASVPGRTLA